MRTLLVLALAVLISACELLAPADEDAELRALTPAEEQVVAAYNDFGLDLFRALDAAGEDSNIFISPVSVSMALGMTLNGAAGETRDAMEDALAVSGLSVGEINDSYRGLIDLLAGLDPKVNFNLANSIWYREGFSVESDFLDVNRESFDAEVRALDFSSPDALGIINGWVDDETRGRIPEIVDVIDPAHVMFLINAIYFKGTWTYEFDASDTRDAPFYGAGGEASIVKMMHQEADLPYFETEAFQAVDLPYGDSLYSMTVLLPRPDRDIDELVASLDADTWSSYAGRFEMRGVDLELPRFELEYDKKLNDVLTELGMGIAFAPGRADFSGVNGDGGLWIDFVRHKSFVEVNEEGTEAAAATVVAIRETSIGGGGPVPVHVDRPFVFTIRERHTGTMLFIGKVTTL